MKKCTLLFISVISVTLWHCSRPDVNKNYGHNTAPLLPNAYIRLPLGSVKPAGWLKSQLEAEASGLAGYLDEYWPDLSKSAWHGGDGDAWERGPYYLDGLVPLAYLLDDKRLIEKVKKWIEPIIASSRDSGWYGPVRNTDRWPLSVSNKVLM